MMVSQCKMNLNFVPYCSMMKFSGFQVRFGNICLSPTFDHDFFLDNIWQISLVTKTWKNISHSCPSGRKEWKETQKYCQNMRTCIRRYKATVFQYKEFHKNVKILSKHTLLFLKKWTLDKLIQSLIAQKMKRSCENWSRPWVVEESWY